MAYLDDFLSSVTLPYRGVGPITVRVNLLGPERSTGGPRRSRGSWPLLIRRVSEENTLKYQFCTKIGALLGQSHLTCVRVRGLQLRQSQPHWVGPLHVSNQC